MGNLEPMGGILALSGTLAMIVSQLEPLPGVPHIFYSFIFGIGLFFCIGSIVAPGGIIEIYKEFFGKETNFKPE